MTDKPDGKRCRWTMFEFLVVVDAIFWVLGIVFGAVAWYRGNGWAWLLGAIAVPAGLVALALVGELMRSRRRRRRKAAGK